MKSNGVILNAGKDLSIPSQPQPASCRHKGIQSPRITPHIWNQPAARRYFSVTSGVTDIPGRSAWSLLSCARFVKSMRTGIRCTTFT
jgi:hypothetical protein